MTQGYYPPQPAGKRVNGMGIAGVVCGILALLFSFVPMCGMIPAIVLGVIGGILALVGFFAAISDGRTGIGFPVMGILLCGSAIVLSIVLTIAGVGAMGAAAVDIQKEVERQQRAATTRNSPTTRNTR